MDGVYAVYIHILLPVYANLFTFPSDVYTVCLSLQIGVECPGKWSKKSS